MQTIQTSSISRLSDSLERRSPDKGLRSSKHVEFEDIRSRDRSPAKAPDSPSPAPKVISENVPPMLALQSIRARQESQPALSDITNGSSPANPYSFESLSSQILHITSIATNLQKEMTNLSKRSKDNATDLLNLKNATNKRDEDIRDSLRDLITGLDGRFKASEQRLLGGPEASRSTPNLGLYHDDKPQTPKSGFSLPRIASPSGFAAAFDRDITASPSLAYADGAASIALLEKVLREMATKEGQERVMDVLENVRSQALVPMGPNGTSQESSYNPQMMAKLEEVLSMMKQLQDDNHNKALVRKFESPRSGSQLDVAFDGDRRGSAVSANSDLVNDDVMKMLKSVKQSLSQGGGLTNEVKALVRELRGEVLGMGREIAKKMESAQNNARAVEPQAMGPTREDIDIIVDDALAELKEHMHKIVLDSQQQSSRTEKPAVDTAAVVYAVTAAISAMPRPEPTQVRDLDAERDDIIAAVKEAWEECKPEVSLEHHGLERDEILETLQEGLKSYQPEPLQPSVNEAGVTYDDVLEAVRKGMADFVPPRIEPEEPQATREEILAAVQEVLENFDWPAPSLAPSSLSTSTGLSRREVIDAVEEGMKNQPPVAKEVEFNREDLFDAIKSCLEGEQNPLGGMGERVVEAMHEFLDSMKNEFQQYSAANGRDTEQVLDALKDGLEDLRQDVQSYVDRAADVTGKEEIIEVVKAGFAGMQEDLAQGLASRPNQSAANTPELLDAMEKEFQHLRDTISKSMVRGSPTSEKDDILDAIRDLSDDRSSALSSNISTDDIVRQVKEELEHMRAALAATLVSGGSSLHRDDVVEAVREGLESHRGASRGDGESILSNTSELLDAFQDGVDNIRSDLQKALDRPVDLTSSYEILDTLKTGIEDVRADISRLQGKQDVDDAGSGQDRAVVVHDENKIATEIEGLKVMITQLRIKVEALDSMEPPIAAPVEIPSEMHIHKDDIDELHNALQGIHATVRQVRDAPGPATEAVMPPNAACKEDTDAIETLLRNMKATVEDLVAPGVDASAKNEKLSAMEDTLAEIKAAVEDVAARPAQNNDSVDLEIMLLTVKDIEKAVGEMQEKLGGLAADDGPLSKTDVQVVETLCGDIKSQIEALPLPDVETLPTKGDVTEIRETIQAFKEQYEADNELTAQAFEARKVEHGGIAGKVDDVKTVLGDLRDELMSKLDGSEEGIVELNKVLGMHHDSMRSYATADSIGELSELVKTEFSKVTEGHTSMKTDAEEKSATLFSKHEETSAEIRAVIEEKFNELMTKYDDAQVSSDAKAASLDEAAKSQGEAAANINTVVTDIRSLMDALGATVTDTCERMSEDSKTVFEKVDESSTKISDLHVANASEHGQTRDEISKAVDAALRLEGSVAENQPALLAAIKEVLDAVTRHYEHSQEQSETFSRTTEEIKSGVRSIPESIPPLLPAPSSPDLGASSPSKYDDSQVHEKLNDLIAHAATAKEMYTSIGDHHKTTTEKLNGMEKLEKLDKLDEIHGHVVAAAGEISSMVATQSRLMAENHESKAQAATEAAIALEKRTAQKEQVEAEIVSLRQEKDALAASMAELRKEHEELSGQTKKLTRDVAKLETALSIRQEEMRDMNNRAEGLERRILEGLMNHARSVRAGKPMASKKISPQERDASMSLKRVSSSASSTATTRPPSKPTSTLGSAVGVALKKRAPLASAANSASGRQSNVDRRILSTSHVTGRSTPDRGAMILAPAPKASSGFIGLKRSQSVKSNPSMYAGSRKPSWNGVMTTSADKENHSDLAEETMLSGDEDEGSDDGTERRTSIVSGTSYMYTDSLAYGTGSEVSASTGRRTLSYASSIGGTINGQTESIAEEDEENAEAEQSAAEEGALTLAEPIDNIQAGKDNSMALTLDGAMDDDDLPLQTPGTDIADFASNLSSNVEAVNEDNEAAMAMDLAPPPVFTDQGMKYEGSDVHGSDSGLGTEPPTATDERPMGEAAEYFAMTQAEGIGAGN
jgi:chromosome segregation ATPase